MNKPDHIAFDPARLPAPDDMGLFMHPDVPDCGEGESIVPYITALGFESCFDTLESDADIDSSAYLAFMNGDENAAALWVPNPPQGAGWLLAAKYDTDDGPAAMWVRPTTGGAA